MARLQSRVRSEIGSGLPRQPQMRQRLFEFCAAQLGKFRRDGRAEHLLSRSQVELCHAAGPIIIAMGGIVGLVRQNEALGPI